MNSDKSSQQKKKGGHKDSLFRWWQRHKTLIAILSVVIPFTIGFNLFLYQWVITPTAEKRVLEAEKELILNVIAVKDYYEGRIDSLRIIINSKESEIGILKTRLSHSANYGYAQNEVALLKQEIELKEREIKFYKEQVFYLNEQLEKAEEMTEKSIKLKIRLLEREIKFYREQKSYLNEQLKKARELIETSTKSQKNKALNSVSLINNQPPLPSDGKKEISKETSTETARIRKPSRLRSQPIELLYATEIKLSLKKHNFFDSNLNKYAQGFFNQFEMQTLNGDTVVIDRASSVMWQQSGSQNRMNFEEAKDWIKELNQKTYGGYDDWRLPTLEEAMSLVESEKKNDLYIDPIFDSKQIWIWTADQIIGESWPRVVSFFTGSCGWSIVIPKYFVRAVRSGQYQVFKPVITRFRSQPMFLSDDEVKSMLRRYDFFDVGWNKNGSGFINHLEVKIINDDTVVIDYATDLIWQRSGSNNYLTYNKAKDYINEINQQDYAGFHDWRLPTIEEAMSLVESEKRNGLCINPVFDSKQRWIWTADQIISESRTLVVYFNSGGFGWDTFYSYFVRAVRSVQSYQE